MFEYILTMSEFPSFGDEHAKWFGHLLHWNFPISIGFNSKKCISAHLHVLPAHPLGRTVAKQGRDESHFVSSFFFLLFYKRTKLFINLLKLFFYLSAKSISLLPPTLVFLNYEKKNSSRTKKIENKNAKPALQIDN